MENKVLKIRLVHCPRCRKLLTEFADIPLYTCGGCGTILQAKKRIGGRGSSTGSTLEAKPFLLDDSGHDEGEPVTSSDQAIASSTDTNCGNSPVESTDCGKNTSECISNSSRISTSGGLNSHIKEAATETGGEPDYVESESLNIEILASNSPLTFKDMQLDAISSSDELNRHGKKVMAGTGANVTESNLNQRRSFNPESSRHGDQLASMSVNDNTVSSRQTEMNIKTEVDESSLNEKVDQPQRLGRCDSDYSRLEDEVDGAKEHTNHNTAHGVLSKSPTNRSSRAYYGSVSSYGDDLDDHLPNRHLHLLERTSIKKQRSAESFDSKEWSMQEYDSELEFQVRKFLPMSSNENYGSSITGSNHRNNDEPSGHPGRGLQAQEQGSLEEPDIFHSVRSWMESEMDVPSRSLSRDTCRQRELPSVYRNGSSSSNGNEELPRSLSMSSNSYAPGNLHRLEQDRMELLTKVEVLKDELQRAYRQKGEIKERLHSRVSQTENWRQPFSSYKSGQELLWYYSASHPWNPPGTYGPRKIMHRQYVPSQIPSSEQSTNCRHHDDYSCLHCFSQDCQFPARLPRSFSYKNQQCRACTGHICHHPSHPYCSSISSSSQQYANSFPGAQPPEKMERSHIKEKHQQVKRHCRPMAGGAPFVVCYKCQKVLQLPADFLLSKRRHHKLQCGVCSKVLLFSLHRSSCKTPSSPPQVRHPPSEVDHSTDAMTGDLASSSHSADCYLRGDPLSCSDDYGYSNSKSYSTEGESALGAITFRVPQSFSHHKNIHASSAANLKPTRQKNKEVFNQFEERSGNSRRVLGSAIAASKITQSEKALKETPEMMRVSPLHQLMGYSSASELLYDSYATNYRASKFDIIGKRTSFSVHEDTSPRTSRNFSETSEENDPQKRSRRNRDISVSGFRQKGLRELNPRQENVKLKGPANGKIVHDHQLVKRAAKQGPAQQYG